MALSLVGGMSLGVSAEVFSTTASASTGAFTLNMTSGTFIVKNGKPTKLPTPASIKGTIDSTTGVISHATLTIPAWHESNTGSTETISLVEATTGSGSGSISYAGTVTYTDTLSLKVHITSPITYHCTATPIHVTLESTSPYNTSTHDVTLKNPSSFTIPDFSSSTCSLAASTLSKAFAGSTGNYLELNLHGTLPEPPAPTATSTTILSATPTSPQLKGTAVTLKATVKKTTGALATTATGTMNFRSGTTVIGSATVSGGTASFTTSTLALGTDKLTAVYSGNSSYKGSTSSALTYVISPAPTVTISGLPGTITGGSTTEHLFTVKITNPSNGATLSELFLKMTLSGINGATSTLVVVQYKDSAGTWCPLLHYTSNASSVISGYFAEAVTCTPASYPASFPLAHSSSLTVPMEIKYPTITGFNVYGVQKIVADLYTGTCTSSSKCTAVAPLSGSAAPSASVTLVVVPATPFASKLSDEAQRKATSTVAKTFDVGLQSAVTPTPEVTGHPAPTGSVSYAITGTVVVTSTITLASGQAGSTKLVLYNTAGLTVGKHHLVSTYTPKTYTGHAIYTSSTLTETFTVTTAPTGTPFVCQISTALEGTQDVPAYVSASGTVPATGTAGTNASVTGVSVELKADPAFDGKTYNTAQTEAVVHYAPTGSTTSVAGPITFSGTTGTATAVTGTWSGMSTSVPVSGTEVHVGANSIRFGAGFAGWDCTPAPGVTPPYAHIGTIHVVHHTPVTWSLSGCTTGSTTVPAWANAEKIVADGAGGGGGGAMHTGSGWAGVGGAGGSVTSIFVVSGGTTVSASTGCAGNGAPQATSPANGGAAASGWSKSGKGGQGTQCFTFFGLCGNHEGTGGGGGGSTGVCNGASTCTSATLAHVVTVAGGGGGGGETACKTYYGGYGGQAGNGSTTSTSSSKGKGLSGSKGRTGDGYFSTTTGSPGGAGGANNKSSGSGSATGGAGGNGSNTNYLGRSSGAGGGGAGYIGGAGGTKSGVDADCDAAGGGGGGSSWVVSGAHSATSGTGAAGGNAHGTNGTAGSVTVTFYYTASL